MRSCLLCALLLLALTACRPSTAPVADLGPAAPFQTATASPTATPLPTLTQIFLPTPTPVLYRIQPNDTLLAIAQRFGVSLQDLMAANPGVQPAALIVGQELLIPVNGAAAEPTPTPAPLTVQQANCWPDPTGGGWCFALVYNPFAETLENISAQFILLNEQGTQIDTQIAYAPLDILPPGASMPLGVHFATPFDGNMTPRVQVLTAIRLLPGDQRYLPVSLQNTLLQVETGGRTAQVSGQISLTESKDPARTVWILAIAYDQNGTLVGFRRWQADKPLEAGEKLTFAFPISSIGPAIERVEFLVEARP